MKREDLFNGILSRQAKKIPEFMDVIDRNVSFTTLMESISMKEISDIRKIIITGCGDSYAAGMAMKPLMEKITGLEVEICKCIDFSRYYPAERLGKTPGNPLVVLISVSGTVSRVLEAAKRARAQGANTLAITNSKDTPLAKECAHVIELNTPPLERAPGCSAYVACCHALTLLCVRIGRVIGSYVPALEDVFRKQNMEYIHSFTVQVMEDIALQMSELAPKWKDCKSFDLIGDGGAFASALFSSWKLVESFGGIVNCEDSENWLHENYFFMEPEKIGTIIFADEESPSFNRILETIVAMKKIGRSVLVITDATKDFFEEGICVCQIPKAKDYRCHVLMQHLPVIYLADYLKELLGRHYYREGDGNHWHDPTGVYPIRQSKIVIVT